MQHGDFAGDLADEGHVVFDDDDAVLAFEAQQQFAGLVRFLVGHAGSGFVHEQQFRILREQHADLQPLFLAVAQCAGLPTGLAIQRDGFENFVDAIAAFGCHA